MADAAGSHPCTEYASPDMPSQAVGTGGGSRTHMGLGPVGCEPTASTSSATPVLRSVAERRALRRGASPHLASNRMRKVL